MTNQFQLILVSTSNALDQSGKGVTAGVGRDAVTQNTTTDLYHRVVDAAGFQSRVKSPVGKSLQIPGITFWGSTQRPV